MSITSIHGKNAVLYLGIPTAVPLANQTDYEITHKDALVDTTTRTDELVVYLFLIEKLRNDTLRDAHMATMSHRLDEMHEDDGPREDVHERGADHRRAEKAHEAAYVRLAPRQRRQGRLAPDAVRVDDVPLLEGILVADVGEEHDEKLRDGQHRRERQLVHVDDARERHDRHHDDHRLEARLQVHKVRHALEALSKVLVAQKLHLHRRRHHRARDDRPDRHVELREMPQSASCTDLG